MPISSGALDWPVSYYTKPVDTEIVADGRTEYDPWSHEHAYKNWTWKTRRGKRKKRKDKENPDEIRRHRRRCCCCVVWWLTAFLLILLTLVLFLVFWIRDRAHDLPPIDPEDFDSIPHCEGVWRETVILYHIFSNRNSSVGCCYSPDKSQIADLLKRPNVWPDAYIADKCTGSEFLVSLATNLQSSFFQLFYLGVFGHLFIIYYI